MRSDTSSSSGSASCERQLGARDRDCIDSSKVSASFPEVIWRADADPPGEACGLCPWEMSPRLGLLHGRPRQRHRIALLHRLDHGHRQIVLEGTFDKLASAPTAQDGKRRDLLRGRSAPSLPLSGRRWKRRCSPRIELFVSRVAEGRRSSADKIDARSGPRVDREQARELGSSTNSVVSIAPSSSPRSARRRQARHARDLSPETKRLRVVCEPVRCRPGRVKLELLNLEDRRPASGHDG